MRLAPPIIIAKLVVFCISIGTTQVAVSATLHVPSEFETIQAAIDTARQGDTILVDQGTYREPLQLKPGISLRSSGDDTKGDFGLKRAEATILDGGNDKISGVRMAEDATLDGFTITNVGRYDHELWNQHHASQGAEQSHDHIGHFGTPAIAIAGVTCVVRNNIVHHNGDTGIAIRGADGARCSPHVYANVCYRNMGGGIGSMNGSTAMIDSNVCFQNFYAGIGHDNASPSVTNNACYENIRAGIGISEGASPLVRDNRCYKNRRAGIGIRTGATTRPIIEGNDCFENDMAGIGCEEQSEPIIRNNHCYKNQLAGIGAQSEAKPIIVGNRCSENQQAGIGVRTGAAAVLCFNKCIENKLVAIGLPDGATACIYGNELSRTGGVPPLLALKGGARATLVGNTMQGGGVAAILVQGDAMIHDNRFQGRAKKQGSAVWAWDGSNVVLTNNRFDGYKNALNARGSSVAVADNQVRTFQDAAFVISNAPTPALVSGNQAFSDSPKDVIVFIAGRAGIEAENSITAEPDKLAP